MAKKTFEQVQKVTITAKDIFDMFVDTLWGNIILSDSLMTKFFKSYDFDRILNSTAFNKFVTGCMKDGAWHVDDLCSRYLDEHDKEYDKILKAYEAFVAANVKPVPVVSKEFSFKIETKEDEIQDIIRFIRNKYPDEVTIKEV